ncbi:MAG: hypothetical protein Q9174_003109, partial [Haloplaca sp. 1 TL-2023]
LLSDPAKTVKIPYSALSPRNNHLLSHNVAFASHPPTTISSCPQNPANMADPLTVIGLYTFIVIGVSGAILCLMILLHLLSRMHLRAMFPIIDHERTNEYRRRRVERTEQDWRPWSSSTQRSYGSAGDYDADDEGLGGNLGAYNREFDIYFP